jgi:hypothetical protein
LTERAFDIGGTINTNYRYRYRKPPSCGCAQAAKRRQNSV